MGHKCITIEKSGYFIIFREIMVFQQVPVIIIIKFVENVLDFTMS